MVRSMIAQRLNPSPSTVKRPRLSRTGGLIAALAAILTMLTPTAAFAAGPSRNGDCQEHELCMYSNSNIQGSVSDFTPEQLSIPNYGNDQPRCYEFKGSGNGQGRCIKNQVASVWNRTGRTINIYYNSNYNGDVAVQVLQPGFKGNLNASLKNNNASHSESQPDQNTTHAEVVPPSGITSEQLLSAAKSAAAGCAGAVAGGFVVDVTVVAVTGGAGIVISGPKIAVECVVGAVTPGVGKLVNWWLHPGNEGIPDQEYPFEFRNPPTGQPAPYNGQPSPTPGPSPTPPSR